MSGWGALDPGAAMPDGDLTDVDDRPTTLAAVRDGRPAVIVFYRGGWCPYCNLTLQRYERELVPILRSRGIPLIAISPELPDGSLAMQEVPYAVLSDAHSTIARQLGILTSPAGPGAADAAAWRASWAIADGVALADDALPVPTTAIVDAAGTIAWIEVHADPAVRAEPSTILAALSAMVSDGSAR